MRQWLEAGYFKGDLPISQQPPGPFHALSAIFPDLSVAFRAQVDTAAQEEAERAAAEERARNEAAEEEELRLAAETVEAKAREAAEQKKAEDEAVAAKVASSNGGNEPSTQLKMMLGLSAENTDGGPIETKEPEPTPEPSKQKASEKRSSKGSNKKSQQKVATEMPEPASEMPSQSATKPASAAWGGVASTKPKKSMSEIQQEEARAAAVVAMQKESFPKQSSSGWANVAASGTAGWSSGTLKQSPPAGIPNPAASSTSRGSTQRAKTQGAVSSAPPAPIVQQQRSSSVSSATPAEEFGATMSPALEKWCKEQMQDINGSDDLTLVAFCMTLTDANEIRQYLTTYLGSTSQVNNFATEFINKRGLGTRQEEWETPGSAKKSRKKKTGAR
jgi:hypothetical protein